MYGFNFHNPEKKLQILEMIQEIHRRQFILYGKPGDENIDYFPTDGLILMDNNKNGELWKLNPRFHMTADLLHQGNIYRCDWNMYDNKWDLENGQVRTDKEYPNPDTLVKKLECFHRNPWTLKDIRFLIQPEFYYGCNLKKDNFTQAFIRGCQDIT